MCRRPCSTNCAEWRNTVEPAPPIPDSVLTKPPSAELRPDQQDTDSLPPYEELDPIIAAYVEDDLGIDEIVAAGIGAGAPWPVSRP